MNQYGSRQYRCRYYSRAGKLCGNGHRPQRVYPHAWAGGNSLTTLYFDCRLCCAARSGRVLFRLTSYDDVQEILYVPALAMSYAGLMIAIGIIVGHAAKGDFVDYVSSFAGFAGIIGSRHSLPYSSISQGLAV